MSLPYFLTDDPAAGVLTGAEAKHAHVKRIQPGEHIMLIDGQGSAAEATVTRVDGQRVECDVVRQERFEQPTPRVTVVQAVPKGERAELAVDLAVQGGADAIVPWISHRTIARWPANKQAKQVAKWRTQALASAKQARRAWVPEVREPVTTNQLSDLLRDRRNEGHALVLHEDATESIREVEFGDEVWLIVGPEGGIGEDELELLQARPVKLGPEVLRTASAAFAGLCAIGALTARW
ncbi:16S rRNA (uracil(1498)-N(3))-methyltransferase [Corynebacterium sp. zg912]|uniref:Ribosomal RNA small subunit methyltransferase E n=1 Tax=Corynebacterium wankanglinii TaxID=2735136 RepID=A0A7H0K9G0_9CORY|nr:MULTISPECIES: 16S rRNA (uracil(1498)-N(3))-methyltransferase [Corynebacterium]MBA1838029.1 16S rRNA (uracil(1498)-N(3))-methyltransferase [Corynebacterium wankanglinii]MCR5929199.1 16S rRNA (uracil(1498)-N(3))-methyltransferase [Corynebacterium sp. zg912]QNP93926.1 16S rRNA (uracil(1498)-N(3))-methyltransferase [Corynebacterium wankanglinii]